MKGCLLSFVLVLAVAAGASAQSWKDLLGKAASEVSATKAGSAVTNVLSVILGNSSALSYDALVGTWGYEGVACVLESESALSNIGGSVVTGALESKIDEKLAAIGISKGNCSFTFSKDGACVVNAGSYIINGKYELDAKEKVIVFSFMYDKLPVKTYVSYEIQNLNIVFKADRLLSLIKNVASNLSQNANGGLDGQLQAAMQAVGTMGALLENYDGMMLGAKLSKVSQASAAVPKAGDVAGAAKTEGGKTTGAAESTAGKVLKGLGGLFKK